jgi:hypothetical protein
MGLMIVMGLLMLWVSRQNRPVGSAPPRADRVRDKATQWVASSWHIRGPIEGTRHPRALYQSPGREVFFMPLRVNWHLAVWVFPIGITWESRLKPPGQNLPGVALPPIWSYGEALTPADSHSRTVNQTPITPNFKPKPNAYSMCA